MGLLWGMISRLAQYWWISSFSGSNRISRRAGNDRGVKCQGAVEIKRGFIKRRLKLF